MGKGLAKEAGSLGPPFPFLFPLLSQLIQRTPTTLLDCLNLWFSEIT